MKLAERIADFLWVFRSGRCEQCGRKETSIEVTSYAFGIDSDWFCTWTCFCEYWKRKLKT